MADSVCKALRKILDRNVWNFNSLVFLFFFSVKFDEVLVYLSSLLLLLLLLSLLTELGRHFFNSQDCNFDRNLKVHILQQVKGNETDLGNFEDKWITRLDTKEPHGMNSTMGELAKTHYKLFPSF